MPERIKSKVVKLLPALPDAQIAREVNCSRERVRQIRFREQIPSPHPHLVCSRSLTEEQVAEYVKLNELMPIAEIERRYGISYWKIAKCIHIAKGKAKHHLNYNQKVTPELIIPLLEQKFIYTKIAEILGVHWGTVARWKRKLGYSYSKAGRPKGGKNEKGS